MELFHTTVQEETGHWAPVTGHRVTGGYAGDGGLREDKRNGGNGPATKLPPVIKPNFKVNNFGQLFISRFQHNSVRLLYRQLTEQMTAPNWGSMRRRKNQVINERKK